MSGYYAPFQAYQGCCPNPLGESEEVYKFVAGVVDPTTLSLGEIILKLVYTPPYYSHLPYPCEGPNPLLTINGTCYELDCETGAIVNITQCVTTNEVSYSRTMFFSNCSPSLAVGCFLKFWNGSIYVDADKAGIGDRFSDGQYCYRVENGIIVEMTNCPNTIFISACHDPYTDAFGCLNVNLVSSIVFDYWSNVGMGYEAAVNTYVTAVIDILVDGTFTTQEIVMSQGQYTKSESVCGFTPDMPVQSLQITSVYVGVPGVTSFNFRYYFVGSVCQYNNN